MKRLCRLLSRTHIALAILTTLLLADFEPRAANAQGPKGFRVDYFDAWPESEQIKYIRVEISALSGVSSRDFDFHVVATTSGGGASGTTVSTIVPIRKGDSKVSGELYVPVSSGYNFALHTELDGNLKANRTDYAYHNYFDYRYSNANFKDSTPSLVFASSEVVADESIKYAIMTGGNSIPTTVPLAVSDDFASLDDLEQWYEAIQVNVGGGKKYMNINGFTSAGVAAMSLDALPSRWFGYEGIGLFVITLDDLKLLAKKHPGKLLAIERWVAASGRMAVLHCGNKFQKVNEVLGLLDDENDARFGERDCSWLGSAVNEDQLQSAMEDATERAQQNGGYYYGGVQAARDRVRLSKSKLKLTHGDLKTAKGKAKDYIAVDFEQGHIICVGDSASDWSQQRPKNVDSWGSLGLFLTHLSQFEKQQGLLCRDTDRNLGFPEFAEPPRYVFEFSILAYLFAVGPIAYFVLKRRQKLNLMFVVVPAISSVFCTVILAWAIFAEGFDTRVNQFTWTQLNQQSGRQTTSTISHVYSGLTPAPYRLTGSTYGFVNLPSYGRSQRVLWGPGTEEVSGGEIRARTNHQLFSRCSNETSKRLVFAMEGEGVNATASVRNDFETTMVGLAFRSDECAPNQCWYCAQLAPGTAAKAEKLEYADAARRIRNEIRARGSSTVFAAGKKYASSPSSATSYRFYGPEIGSISGSDVSQSLSKAWHFSETQLAKMFSENSSAYFALTAESTNYESGITNAKIEAEIHILQGVR